MKKNAISNPLHAFGSPGLTRSLNILVRVFVIKWYYTLKQTRGRWNENKNYLRNQGLL